jgi:hypothetical protein
MTAAFRDNYILDEERKLRILTIHAVSTISHILYECLSDHVFRFINLIYSCVFVCNCQHVRAVIPSICSNCQTKYLNDTFALSPTSTTHIVTHTPTHSHNLSVSQAVNRSIEAVFGTHHLIRTSSSVIIRTRSCLCVLVYLNFVKMLIFALPSSTEVHKVSAKTKIGRPRGQRGK